MSQPVVVRASHRYAAPVDRVFDAWLTPAQAARFLFATRTGNVMRCEIDPREGGGFLVTDRRPNADGDESVFDAEHRGEYVVIDRPNHLVFDFTAPGLGPATRVSLDFRPLTPHACEIQLAHELGDNELAQAFADRTRQGWDNMLTLLERELFPRRIGVQL
jgi:uncharacterized protein YndB with AHSA1/START domain